MNSAILNLLISLYLRSRSCLLSVQFWHLSTIFTFLNEANTYLLDSTEISKLSCHCSIAEIIPFLLLEVDYTLKTSDISFTPLVLHTKLHFNHFLDHSDPAHLHFIASPTTWFTEFYSSIGAPDGPDY